MQGQLPSGAGPVSVHWKTGRATARRFASCPPGRRKLPVGLFGTAFRDRLGFRIKKAALPAAEIQSRVMRITQIRWRVGPAMGPLSAGVRQLPLFGCIGSTHPLDCDVACASETLLPQNGDRMRPRGPNNLRQVAHPHVIHTHTLRDGRMRKQTMRAHSPRGCRAKGCGLPPEVAPPQGRALPGLLFTVLAVVPVKLLVMAMAQRATVIQGLADTR